MTAAKELAPITAACVTDADADRFIAKVTLPEPGREVDECWLWHGAKHSAKRNYGKFWLCGRSVNAHKASYLIFNGDIEEGYVVGHICNNEECCNPYHLIQCTQSDNIRYAVICGRHNSNQRR